MIKNVIFDFGQVLVRFDPTYMVGLYVSDDRDKTLLADVVFDRLYWNELDKGTLGDEELLLLARERLPERLWNVAETIYRNWIIHLPPIDGMAELIRFIKATYNVRCFLLSDISKYFAENCDKAPILQLLDGCVFSGPLGITKPSKEIFEHILNKYGLSAEETVFIDDKDQNIAGANAVGIRGYVFDGDVSKLRRYLDSILKNQNHA